MMDQLVNSVRSQGSGGSLLRVRGPPFHRLPFALFLRFPFDHFSICLLIEGLVGPLALLRAWTALAMVFVGRSDSHPTGHRYPPNVKLKAGAVALCRASELRCQGFSM